MRDVPWEVVCRPRTNPWFPADPTNTLAVNPSQSTTFKVVGEGDFDIEYLDGSSSRGDYFTDVFEIGGATLQNMTMGLGVDTDISYGLVGVGYATNEAIVGNTQSLSSVYPNLPVHMVNEGLINTVAYSLWLNDLGKLLMRRRVVVVPKANAC